MTITLQLTPLTEASLLARAREEGLSLDAYLHCVLQQVAEGTSASAISIEELEAGLDELAEGSEDLPVLPPEAYERESIYGDD